MIYEDKIYDITALEMFKRLEAFLDKRLGAKADNWTVEKKIDFFTQKKTSPEVRDLMHEIRQRRNEIVHPRNLALHAKFCPYPVAILDYDGFLQFQENCFRLHNIYPKLRMKEMMLPTLKYEMGNAGDIVKHGVLAEIVRWHKKAGSHILRFADPFGGSPWGSLRNAEVRRRLSELRETVLLEAYPEKKSDKYWGSSHLVRVLGEQIGLQTKIHVSDADKNAICNLKNSILGYDNMEWIDLPSKNQDGPNNGYQILGDHHPENYDLILIDPYSDFLPRNHRQLSNVEKAVASNSKLFVVVFVLDKYRKNCSSRGKGGIGRTHLRFIKLRDEFGSLACSLRCPAMPGDSGVKGESGYDSEVLIVSRQFKDGKADGLRKELKRFADSASCALFSEKGKVEFWAGV